MLKQIVLPHHISRVPGLILKSGYCEVSHILSVPMWLSPGSSSTQNTLAGGLPTLETVAEVKMNVTVCVCVCLWSPKMNWCTFQKVFSFYTQYSYKFLWQSPQITSYNYSQTCMQNLYYTSLIYGQTTEIKQTMIRTLFLW